MRVFTILAVCTCLIAVIVEANVQQKGQNQRRRFSIPYKAETKKQYPSYGGDPSDPYYYLGDDVISNIIIDLGNYFGAALCVDENFDFPLGYMCDGYCMPIEYICDNFTDCGSPFDDEDGIACQARADAEAIFSYCSSQYYDCYDQGSDYAYDCSTYYDYDMGYSQMSPIYWHQVCDGNMDCADGSDEYGCGTVCPCNSYSMDVVPCDYFCDGMPDCPMGEDEVQCGYSCTFGCDVTEYDYMGYPYEVWGEIPCEWECDGYPDCTYGEDEEEYMCGPQYYMCPVGDEYYMYCTDLPYYTICDGQQDCFDGSDEEYCDYSYLWNYNSTTSYYKKDEKKTTKESLKESGKLRRYDDIQYRIEQQAKRSSKKDPTGVVFKKKENLPKERHFMKTPKQIAKRREMRKSNKNEKGKKQL